MNRTVRAIALVASREVTARVRTRAFRVGTAVMLVAVVVGCVVAAFFLHRESPAPTPTTVAASGLSSVEQSALHRTGEQVGTPVEVVPVASAAQAHELVDTDRAAAAVIGGDGRYKVYSSTPVSASMSAVIQSGLADARVTAALATANVDPQALARASKLSVERAGNESDRHVQERIVVALVGLVLLTYAIMQAGPTVSTGVIEEKASRIVEILLSTLRPGQLMAGKIIGIGLVTLLQLVLVAVVGLVAATVTGLLTLPTIAISTALVTVVAFLLGYLFFAALFAAAGSMVSRVEDSTGTVMPVSMFAFISIYSGLFVILSPDASLVPVLTWLPPFSVSTVPIRIALDDISVLEAAGSAAVMIIATAGVIAFAARIYRQSVLFSGARVSWRRALRGK